MTEPIRVLLVDDERSFREPVHQRLTERGFEVTAAASGPEAVEKATACGGAFDVAVIDQVMALPNGIDTMRELHRHYPGIEAIILTGWGDMTEGERAMDMGAYRYMSKPVSNVDELALIIRGAARLGREKRRGRTLQELVRTGQELGGAESEQELYEQAYQLVKNLLPRADSFLLAEWDQPNQAVHFRFCVVRGVRLPESSRRNHGGITEYVIATGEPLLLANGDGVFRKQKGLQAPQLDGGCASQIAVPMFLKETVVGTIHVLSYDPEFHYTGENLEMLQALANQVSVTIQNLRQHREAQELSDATRRLAANSGDANILESIVLEAHRLIDSEFTGLILQDADGTLRKAQPTEPASKYADFEEPRQQGGVSRHVIDTQLPAVIADTHDDPLVKDAVRQAGIRSMLAIPMIHGDRVLGVLYAHTFKLRYFERHDVNLWSAFAAQAAAALHGTLQAERRLDDARRLDEVLAVLARDQDLRETMTQVATAAKRLFKADTCHLCYVNPTTGQIMDWTWAEDDPEHYRHDAEARPDGMTHYVLRTGKLLFGAGWSDEDGLPVPHPGHLAKGLRAVASLPLAHNGRTLAVLHCNYMRPRAPFDEMDRTMFEAFSARAAAALDRARRGDQSQIWHELDRALTTCSDLDALYDLFTNHALRALCADFAVLFAFDPTARLGTADGVPADFVCRGDLRTPWTEPAGGLGGGVRRAVDESRDGLLIVNDLDDSGGQYRSRLSEREEVRAFVALRLEMIPEGDTTPTPAGLLFLNYRNPTAFEPADLLELQLAGRRVAMNIMRLRISATTLSLFEQRDRLLQAVLDVFQTRHERRAKKQMATRIAEAARDVLGIDSCTLGEYDENKGAFVGRGAAGLEQPDADWTFQPEFKTWFLDSQGPTIIEDVHRDPRTRDSNFVRREGIASVIVHPLRVEDEALGLLFACYRTQRSVTDEELTGVRLFAELAALVLHESRLGNELQRIQRKLQGRLLIDSLTSLDTIWRHSAISTASAIRNHAFVLKERLKRAGQLPEAMQGVVDIVAEIDNLAWKMANPGSRVSEPWEVEAAPLSLRDLLEEAGKGVQRATMLYGSPPVDVRFQHDGSSGCWVYGYRGRLLYAIRLVLENACRAMPDGGLVIIGCHHVDGWVEVRIQDSGEGVPREVQPKLFRELVGKGEADVGMGVGSLLAATIIEEHEGTIELERPGPGDTTVLIRLPGGGAYGAAKPCA
ncbi:MAG: GAF domain-containing protein [Anaerolineae bacterium]